MNKPVYGDSDPIYALATPLAESALALVRTSGPDNGMLIKLLAGIFSRPETLIAAPGNSIVHGWIVDSENKKKIDEVLVSVYRTPVSYTGEDGADISCHGGIASVKAVLFALKKAGFREALPGEFTFRAFMNGKLDLTRSESVMELVGAKSAKARENALARLSGALEKEISSIKKLLVEVLAGTEIYLDYSEDEIFGPDDEKAGKLPARNLAEQAAKRLKTLSEHWRRERIYAEGALVVLAGRPNAGKSSLFNYLVREERSIVTDVPGTTRDWIEAFVSVEGIPLRLVDTAGLRELGYRESDEMERIGVERSLELLNRADLVLYVIDGAKGVTKEDSEFILRHRESPTAKPILVIRNKADLTLSPDFFTEELAGQLKTVSAKTGEGVSELALSIASVLEAASASAPESEGSEAVGPGTLRQKELIDSALDSIEEALALADKEEPLDIIAPFFRSAVNALGEITGEVSNGDVLEIMFSRFCVGK
jgi:tRNA modification GTPase